MDKLKIKKKIAKKKYQLELLQIKLEEVEGEKQEEAEGNPVIGFYIPASEEE